MSAPDALLRPGHHGAPGIPGVTLAERRPALHQVAARRGAAFGLPAPGRSAPMWDGIALGLAPGTAMLLGGARPDLPTEAAAVVDLSDGFAVLRLSGPACTEVLARVCRLDLHENTFPPGACARTPVAQVATILHRASLAGFDLLAPATFAHSLVHALLTAAAPFGCAILPFGKDHA